tara:strand:+ start:866 stop:1411 length:546 start_codon:yes stop_codon:yes gene_type:complete
MNTFKYFIGTLLLISFSLSAQQLSDYGKIYSVKDGDTFEVSTDRENIEDLLSQNLVSKKNVDFSNNTFTVRLSNVDTEESVHRDKSKNTDFGKETSNMAKKKFLGDVVNYTCYEKGYYGRSICSLSSKEDGDYGNYLISNGYSSYETGFGKHPELHWKYLKSEKMYKAKGLMDKAKGFFNK